MVYISRRQNHYLRPIVIKKRSESGKIMIQVRSIEKIPPLSSTEIESDRNPACVAGVLACTIWLAGACDTQANTEFTLRVVRLRVRVLWRVTTKCQHVDSRWVRRFNVHDAHSSRSSFISLWIGLHWQYHIWIGYFIDILTASGPEDSRYERILLRKWRHSDRNKRS